MSGSKRKPAFLRGVLILTGTAALFLGILGVFLPVLPTTPFLIVTAGCYANSSDKLHAKLVKSRIYNNTVEKFLKEKGMSLKAKLSITIPVGILLTVLFFLVEPLVLKIIIVVLFVVKVITFSLMPTISHR